LGGVFVDLPRHQKGLKQGTAEEGRQRRDKFGVPFPLGQGGKPGRGAKEQGKKTRRGEVIGPGMGEILRT